MKAYLLAAGYATRMHPLTLDRAKPLLEVGGAPILSHILRAILRLPGLSEVIVVTNDRFHAQFLDWASGLDLVVPLRILNDGTRDDVTRLGATGDIGFALREAPPGDEPWVVVAGDNLFAFDLLPLYEVFTSRGTPMLIVRDVPQRLGPSRYGEVTLGPGDRVVAFREKPADPRTGIAAIALYFFTPGVASAVARYLEGGGNPDAPGHFIAWLVTHTEVTAVRMPGEWFDIGSLETLRAARDRFGDPPA